jgi:peroxiredoxin
MTIETGDTLPEAKFSRIGENGAELVTLSDLTKGRKIVLFAVPGAFTPTCHSAHVPSFIRCKDALKAKGVDEIICVSVNDAFVMKTWGEVTGAHAAGLTMLADGAGEFTREMGFDFSAPIAGLMGRSKRYAMMVDNGVVQVMHVEESAGVCEISGGEAMVAAI